MNKFIIIVAIFLLVVGVFFVSKYMEKNRFKRALLERQEWLDSIPEGKAIGSNSVAMGSDVSAMGKYSIYWFDYPNGEKPILIDEKSIYIGNALVLEDES